MAAHTSVQARHNDGHQVSLQHTSTDSPILPAENLKVLFDLSPSLVEFVVEQTKLEATHRRKEESKVNWFVFLERVSGIVAGTFVAISGLGIAAYLVVNGHDWAGVTLGTVELALIVSILVARKLDNDNLTQKVIPPKKPRQKRTPNSNKN